MRTHDSSHDRTCTMSCDQTYPLPQVFFVNEGGGVQRPVPTSNLVPCWSFAQPPGRTRSQGRSRGCMGASTGGALVVLLLFLLVFTALGFEAYQIQKMQKNLKDLKETPEGNQALKLSSPEKQIGGDPTSVLEEWNAGRPAAHLMGSVNQKIFPQTLRWDPHVEPAFTSGGVTYRAEDGALQVSEAGRYHVYSRVEFILKDCSPFAHTMFVRREGHPLPEVLMKGHREGLCSQAGHSWTTESYLGSAVQLQKHDRVYVNVTHPRQLTHAHYSNFFGLYKI